MKNITIEDIISIKERVQIYNKGLKFLYDANELDISRHKDLMDAIDVSCTTEAENIMDIIKEIVYIWSGADKASNKDEADALWDKTMSNSTLVWWDMTPYTSDEFKLPVEFVREWKAESFDKLTGLYFINDFTEVKTSTYEALF